MIGPRTSTQKAAARYRERWGWPVFSSTFAVWLRLPVDMAAISIVVPDSRIAKLRPVIADLAGPVVDYSDGHYAVLTSCTLLAAGHIGTGRGDVPVAHLGVGESVDLPPTLIAGGGAAVWLRPPHGDPLLPHCARILDMACSLTADQL